MTSSLLNRAPRAPAHFVSIVDLAKRLGITARALRFYQDRGLIRSHRIARNIRAYDLEAVAIIERIVALREAGLSIATIRDILTLRGDLEAQAVLLRAALLDVRAERQRQITRIDDMLETLVDATSATNPFRDHGVVPAAWRTAPRASSLDGLATGGGG
jgi:DNA-binding transcriptional MerR regulator